MNKFTLDDIKGKIINKGTVNERRVKLVASPISKNAIREEFGCGVAIISPGQVHEEHAHCDNKELILVLQGSGIAVVGGKSFTFEARDFIAIDKSEPHMFTNTGEIDVQFYWIYSPSGPEVRFADENPGDEI